MDLATDPANAADATDVPSKDEQSNADRAWMLEAIALAHKCPRSTGAYNVGAIIVDRDGQRIAAGYSRRTDPHVHAEEDALAQLPADDPRLPTATLYSSLEPCTQRASRPRSCTELIIAGGIGRVVIAWREPSLFVADCQGHEQLTAAGITVTELPDLAARAREPNTHLPLDDRKPGPSSPG